MAAKTKTKAQPHSRRNWWMLSGLCASLAVVGLALLLLAPQPLAGGAVQRLYAQNERALSAIYETDAGLAQHKWKVVYLHHTAAHAVDTDAITAQGLGDHFLIGNGQGVGDGEIVIGHRWNQQLAALPPAGLKTLPAGTLSIGLVGDFSTKQPTSAQLRALQTLLASLHERVGIDTMPRASTQSSAAGLGRLFPIDAIVDAR